MKQTLLKKYFLFIFINILFIQYLEATGQVAPSGLKYASPKTFTAGVAITNLSPTVNGSAPNYLVTSDLPKGLNLDSHTGVISGIPTVAGTGTYKITATNSAGSVPFLIAITVNPGAFSQLQILLPGEMPVPGTPTGKTGTIAIQTAGKEFNVTVNAVDANWNVVTTANDNIGITSGDLKAMLPLSAALITGTKVFSVTLKTAGSQTVIATDAVTSFAVNTTVNVNPADFDNFLVENAKGGDIETQKAGVPFNIKITARDAYNNTVTSFNSTATLTTSATFGSISPTTSPAFRSGVLASQNVTVTQATNQAIFAVSGSTRTVTNTFDVAPGALSQLQILLPGEIAAPGTVVGKTGSPVTQKAAMAFYVTVNGVDANWNVVSSSDEIRLSSSDKHASPKKTAKLETGVKIFSVIVKTVDLQTLTVDDIANTKITASTGKVEVRINNDGKSACQDYDTADTKRVAIEVINRLQNALSQLNESKTRRLQRNSTVSIKRQVWLSNNSLETLIAYETAKNDSIIAEANFALDSMKVEAIRNELGKLQNKLSALPITSAGGRCPICGLKDVDYNFCGYKLIYNPCRNCLHLIQGCCGRKDCCDKCDQILAVIDCDSKFPKMPSIPVNTSLAVEIWGVNPLIYNPTVSVQEEIMDNNPGVILQVIGSIFGQLPTGTIPTWSTDINSMTAALADATTSTAPPLGTAKSVIKPAASKVETTLDEDCKSVQALLTRTYNSYIDSVCKFETIVTENFKNLSDKYNDLSNKYTAQKKANSCKIITPDGITIADLTSFNRWLTPFTTKLTEYDGPIKKMHGWTNTYASGFDCKNADKALSELLSYESALRATVIEKTLKCNQFDAPIASAKLNIANIIAHCAYDPVKADIDQLSEYYYSATTAFNAMAYQQCYEFDNDASYKKHLDSLYAWAAQKIPDKTNLKALENKLSVQISAARKKIENDTNLTAAQSAFFKTTLDSMQPLTTRMLNTLTTNADLYQQVKANSTLTYPIPQIKAITDNLKITLNVVPSSTTQKWGKRLENKDIDIPTKHGYNISVGMGIVTTGHRNPTYSMRADTIFGINAQNNRVPIISGYRVFRSLTGGGFSDLNIGIGIHALFSYRLPRYCYIGGNVGAAFTSDENGSLLLGIHFLTGQKYKVALSTGLAMSTVRTPDDKYEVPDYSGAKGAAFFPSPENITYNIGIRPNWFIGLAFSFGKMKDYYQPKAAALSDGSSLTASPAIPDTTTKTKQPAPSGKTNSKTTTVAATPATTTPANPATPPTPTGINISGLPTNQNIQINITNPK